jgi:hypothetical protein
MSGHSNPFSVSHKDLAAYGAEMQKYAQNCCFRSSLIAIPLLSKTQLCVHPEIVSLRGFTMNCDLERNFSKSQKVAHPAKRIGSERFM